MSEFKGTPGPWQVYESGNDSHPFGVCTYTGDEIESIVGLISSGYSPNLENAQLIAAAPELLAAMQRLLTALSEIDACSAAVWEAYNVATATVAKALGETYQEAT